MKCHTGPYEDADAEALVTQIKCRQVHQPIPQVVLDQPLQQRAIRPSIPPGPVLCSNQSCIMNSGTHTKGSKACVDLLCKNCCESTADDCRRDRIPRDQCKYHRHDAVRVAPPPPVQPPSVELFTLDLTLAASSGPYIVTAPPSSLLTQPTSSLRPSGRRCQPLAQPISKAWTERFDQAQQHKKEAQSLKLQRQQIDDRARREFDVVFYFAVSHLIHIQLYLIIDHWTDWRRTNMHSSIFTIISEDYDSSLF